MRTVQHTLGRIGRETVIGAAAGALIVITSVIDIVLSGFDRASVFEGIKDIAGVIVDLMLFFMAFKGLLAAALYRKNKYGPEPRTVCICIMKDNVIYVDASSEFPAVTSMRDSG